MPQEPPKTHPRPPKSAKEPPKMPQDPQKTTQDARKMPPTYSKTSAFFAYGTLKRNRRNHDLLTGSRFIGKGVTAQKYGFYLGPDEQSLKGSSIPYLFKEPRKGDQAVRVYGEVWEVNEFTLNQLDQFFLIENPLAFWMEYKVFLIFLHHFLNQVLLLQHYKKRVN